MIDVMERRVRKTAVVVELAVRPTMIECFREACRHGEDQVVLSQVCALKLLSEIEELEKR